MTVHIDRNVLGGQDDDGGLTIIQVILFFSEYQLCQSKWSWIDKEIGLTYSVDNPPEDLK